MKSGLQTLVVGGGMITADLILPSLYHLQRRERVAEITVCALNSGPLRALADNAEISGAFPGGSFIAQPSLATPTAVCPAHRAHSASAVGRGGRAGPDALFRRDAGGIPDS